MLNSIIQKVVDPFLLRIAKRMEMLVEEGRINTARRSATISPTAKIYPTAQVKNFLADPKAITIGAYSHIECQLLVFWDGGRIDIGEWCHFAAGTRILSQASISIGNRVGISHLVDIHDSDCHPIGWQERRLDAQELMSGKYRVPTKTVSKPVIIEDDVLIGMKSTILKGVRIGQAAIVGACSLVVEDVPAWTIVAGSPAKVVRELKR